MRLLALVLATVISAPVAAVSLEDYLPDDTTYDPSIPKPESIVGFEVGEWHVRHDQLVAYMKALADASPRIAIEQIGLTHEKRPLLLLTVTSPKNLTNIESIKSQRQTDPDNGKLVVWEGFSVHGNEASGANASLLFAYYLAAAQGAWIDEVLSDTVILIDPSLNPDGQGRFSQWANSYHAQTPNPDPNNRVHHEVWPNGRTNHYWFDLNRDWILLVHPETRARVSRFHQWRPHVLTDFHEMWSNSTYFFQPGVPKRVNPLTPDRNAELTQKIGEYHAAALESLGRLYFTKEVFDDFYYGKGSSYPDVNGAIGILFEQASTRGQVIDTIYGELDFPASIQSQFATALSTLRAAHDMADELRVYQARFYEGSAEQADQDAVKGYVIGDGGDPARAYHLLDLLRRHGIEVHELARELAIDGVTYRQGHSWVVPTEQRRYLLVKALMEKTTAFADSTFYDVSAWTLPLSFNLPYARLDRRQASEAVGEAIDTPSEPRGNYTAAPEPYAYAIEWNGYYAPRALQRLLADEVMAFAATKPFTAASADGEHSFDRGTIVVPVGIQQDKRDAIDRILPEIARVDGLDVHVLTTGLMAAGIDLGSPSMRRIKPVKPLLFVGPGVSGNAAGEVWHLLDTRVGLPLTMVDIQRFDGIDLGDYTHLIVVNGDYKKVSDKQTERIRDWLSSGGILVATQKGAKWATDKELHVKEKDDTEDQATDQGEDEQEEEDEAEEDDDDRFRPYASFRDDRSKRRISGAIFEIHLDNTHPLGYGYAGTTLPVFRSGTVFLDPSENPYETVGRYTDQPLMSGYVGPERLEELRGSAAIVANRVGKGAVIRMADDPDFRGIWYGTNRLLLNALFLAQTIDPTKLD
jgi:hypothetical protein